MAPRESAEAVRMAASIVSAYISRNSLPQSELCELDFHSPFGRRAFGGRDGGAGNRASRCRPAVPIKKSFTNEYVICLEDGRKFKSLKRHLRMHYGLTPEQYRAKWGLADDHPIVAPGYAEIRSRMAKDMGLGQQKRSKARKKPG